MNAQRFAIFMTFCCTMLLGGPTWADDGTVTINGLVWLKDPASCLGTMTWYQAKNDVPYFKSGSCPKLNDGSKAGDWRLPTREELSAVYASKSKLGAIKSDYYWTSTEAYGGVSAYIIYMGNGSTSTITKSNPEYSIPVRSPKK